MTHKKLIAISHVYPIHHQTLKIRVPLFWIWKLKMPYVWGFLWSWGHICENSTGTFETVHNIKFKIVCLSDTVRKIDSINKWHFLILELIFREVSSCLLEAKLLETERKVIWVSTKILSTSEKGSHVVNHCLGSWFLIKLQICLERFFFPLVPLLCLCFFFLPPSLCVCVGWKCRENEKAKRQTSATATCLLASVWSWDVERMSPYKSTSSPSASTLQQARQDH